MVCVLCEKESVENWFGSFCVNCRKIKNLGNVYGFDRIYGILEKCCIRDETQLENKINNHKKEKQRLPSIPEELEKNGNESDDNYEKPKTRAKKTK